jgi:uncharacterized membrane protein YphA (DoxX/SURF4 family)
MPAFIAIGRVLFAVLFIVSGASKLLDIAATTQMTEKIMIPAMLSPYTDQLATAAGMPIARIMAIAAGALELICGFFIALNFAARFFALLLVLFVIATTFYFHDFWNQTGDDARNNMIHALKNLSLIGALFIIAGIGRGARRDAEPSYTDA